MQAGSRIRRANVKSCSPSGCPIQPRAGTRQAGRAQPRRTVQQEHKTAGARQAGINCSALRRRSTSQGVRTCPPGGSPLLPAQPWRPSAPHLQPAQSRRATEGNAEYSVPPAYCAVAGQGGRMIGRQEGQTQGAGEGGWVMLAPWVYLLAGGKPFRASPAPVRGRAGLDRWQQREGMYRRFTSEPGPGAGRPPAQE